MSALVERLLSEYQRLKRSARYDDKVAANLHVEAADHIEALEATSADWQEKFEQARRLYLEELHTRLALEASLASTRAEVVEECAKVAESFGGGYPVNNWAEGYSAAVEDIAEGIRALIPAPPASAEGGG